MTDTVDVTHLLRRWSSGDQDARDQLVPVVYDTLRRLALRYLADERSIQTLTPTALVHEAYLRLTAQAMPDWQSRSHFFGIAARLMRQILVDDARRRQSAKRGAGYRLVCLDDAGDLALPGRGADILALDEALEALEAQDARKARVIELRYFAGCTEEETAQSMGLSVATVRRDTRLAEAFLATRMTAP